MFVWSVNYILYTFILPSRLYLTEIGLTCVHYSYLRQAIHDRVTSAVDIAKKQMAAIFSLDLSLVDELRSLAA